jgi:glycosyltransferase involved in cell wall biosynthesis
MVEALRPQFQLSGFCRGGAEDLQSLPRSTLASAFSRLPYVRRLRDWQVLIEERSFDRRVAKRLQGAALFQGVAGQCGRSLEKARSIGSASVLDALNPHVDHFGPLDDFECAKLGMRPLLHPRMRRLMRKEYAQADVIRVESRFSRETFLERGFEPERVVAVRPTVEVDAFVPTTFSEGIFRVLFVGLFQPWKGFRYLVDAFDSIALRDSELVLWGGVGSRAVAHYLAARAAKNPAIRVRAGNLRQLGYDEAYGRASVLVHPSLADGWGYVVSEAMASGVPVIATSYTGASELIQEGHNGYVVPPQDSGAIAERLLHLARNPELLPKLGTAARQTARALDFETFRSRYARFLRGVMPTPRSQ